MEYARKRKRRRKHPSGAGKAIPALLMIGLVIYLFTASAAGKWLAEEVMAPAFSALSSLPVFNSDAMNALEQETASDGETLAVDLHGGLSSVSENVQMPAINCYALQMGVFSSSDNAARLSEDIKARGAGGYVYSDDGMYRVFAAGYSSDSEAHTVKTRLTDEGTDCTVFDMSAPAVTFSITAGRNDIDAIREAFYSLYDAQSALCAACIEFDQDSMSPSEGTALIKEIQTELSPSLEVLKGYGDSSSAMGAISQCCDKCMDILTALSEGSYSSSTQFASAMKHALLEFSDTYATMLRSIGG